MTAKKFLQCFVALAVVSLTVVGGAVPARAEEPSDVTLKLIDTSEAHGYALQAMAEQYEEMTGTKVEVEILPYDQTFEKQVLMFSSGGSDYDLVVYDCIWGAQFLANNWLLNIAPYMEDPNLPDINMDEFVPGIAEAYDIRGDAIYSIPVDYTNIIMGYRTDLFEEAGLPGPPKTWDEFAEYAEKLTKDTDGDGEIDQYGFIWHGGIADSACTDWWVRVLGFELPEGLTEFVLTPDVSKTAFMDYDYGVEGLQKVLDVIDYAPPGCLGYGYGESIQAFSQGIGAMFMSWNVMFSEFDDPEKSEVAGKVGYTAVPFDEAQNIYAGGWHMGINANSKHPEEAYKFLAWVASDEGQLAMIENGAMTPYKQFIFDSEEWTSQYPIFTATAEAGAGNVMPFPLTPKFVEMQQILFEQLQAAYGGMKSPEDALSQASEEIDAMLAE
jgi:ABC-type glycerol-3-phosphate transport system substrate-binding protein